MAKSLIGGAVDSGDVLQNLLDRIATLEQNITSPTFVVPNGSSPQFGTISLGGSGTPLSDQVSAPTSLTLTPLAQFSSIYLKATWVAPIDNSAASYIIMVAKKNIATGVYTLWAQQNVNGTTAFVYDLEPNTTYGVRVFGVSYVGVPSSVALPATGWTDVSTGIDSTIPATPTGLTVAAGPSTLTAFWNDNTEADVALGAGSYELQYATNSLFTSASSIKTSGTIATISGLDYTHTYYFRLRAVDASGNQGPWTSTVSLAPGTLIVGGSDGLPPSSSPTPTVIGTIGPALLIKFPMISNVDPVTYEIHLSTTSGFTPSSGTKSTESGSSNVVVFRDAAGAALVYGRTYYCKIIANDIDGSAAASAQGSGVPVQAAPGDLGGGSVTADTISLGAISNSMVRNGSFEDPAPIGAAASVIAAGWTTFTGATVVSTGARSGTKAITSAPSGTSPVIASDPVAVSAGDTITMRMWALTSVAQAAGMVLRAFWFTDLASAIANTISSTSDALGVAGSTTSYQQYSGQVVVPAGIKYAKFGMYSTLGTVTVDDFEVRRVIQGVDILAGTITAAAIATGTITAASGVIGSLDASTITTGSMSATFLTAGTLTSDRIVTAGLDAAVIKFGVMSGDRISANTLDILAIKTGTLSARTITLAATGQIIGGSNPSGVGSAQSGFIINGSGYTAINAGVVTFQITNTGTAFFKGDITGASGTFSGNLTGNTITGATIVATSIPGVNNANLVQNPNFAIYDASNLMLNWNYSTLPSGGLTSGIGNYLTTGTAWSVKLETVSPIGGATSLTVTTTSNTAGVLVQSDLIACVPAENLVLRMDYKQSGALRPAYVGLLWFDATGAAIPGATTVLTPAAAYYTPAGVRVVNATSGVIASRADFVHGENPPSLNTIYRIAGSTTVPAGANFCRLFFGQWSSATASSTTVFTTFDNISLTKQDDGSLLNGGVITGGTLQTSSDTTAARVVISEFNPGTIYMYMQGANLAPGAIESYILGGRGNLILWPPNNTSSLTNISLQIDSAGNFAFNNSVTLQLAAGTNITTASGSMIINPANNLTLSPIGNVTLSPLGTIVLSSDTYAPGWNSSSAGVPVLWNTATTPSGRVNRNSSSKRYKRDITPMQLATAKRLLDVPVVTYRDKGTTEKSQGKRHDKIHWGLIAEDTAEVLDEIVFYDNKDRPDSVQYLQAWVGLIPLVKDLYGKIDALTHRVMELENAR